MRRVINSTYMSLDGVVENPSWTVGHGSPDATRHAVELLAGADTLVMGRRTYESFAAVWPTLEDDTGMSVQVNAMRKIVASDTLTEPEWTSTTVTGVKEFPDMLRELKEQPGRDVIQYGFGPLTAALMREHLLDELQVWLYPLFCGAPAPTDVLALHTVAATFELADVLRYDSGLLILSYRPVAG